jgi:uncharacterized membrane protein
MPFINKHARLLLLFFLILIAAILRFWQLGDMSMSNDELSALSRVRFDSFGELIEKGVVPDGHPAGVQVFLYYWTKVAGVSEIAVRSPFVIFSLLSIVMVYLIGKKWFGELTGMMSAASLACLQFPLYYGMLSRPYSPGLLFALCTAYFWTLVIAERERKVLHMAGLILSAALCMYTHYFSFLFALVIGVTGLFYMNRENYRNYLLCMLITGLLYIPHAGIFMEQLARDGLGWLGKPEKTFLWDFIRYIFNDSWLLLAAAAFILIVSIAYNYKKAPFNRYHLLAVLWFLIPFLVGYLKSVYSKPVLQFSGLLFSFPFLILFIFSFFPRRPMRYTDVLLAAGWTAICLYSTLIEKRFFREQHHSEFKGLATTTLEWSRQYGAQNITRIANINNPYYIHYYLDRYDVPLPFAQYRNDGGADNDSLQRIVENSNTEYMLHAWSGKFVDPANLEIIRKKYPVEVDKKDYLRSGIVLFKRNP